MEWREEQKGSTECNWDTAEIGTKMEKRFKYKNFRKTWKQINNNKIK